MPDPGLHPSRYNRWRAAAVAVTAGLAAIVTGPTALAEPGVSIRGTIVRADGRPAAGAPIVLTKKIGTGEILTDLFVTAFTGGLAAIDCAFGSRDPSILEICSKGVYATRTDRTGRFRVDLTAAQARTNTGNRRFDLAVSLATHPGDHAKAQIVAPLNLDQPVIQLPALRFWETAPAIRATGMDAELSATLPPENGYTVRPFEVSGAVVGPNQVHLVEVNKGSDIARFDLRLLEDLRTATAVVAQGRLRFDGGITNIRYTSPTTGFAGRLRPASRGRSCTAETTGGVEQHARCWLTDGNLGAGGRERPLFGCRPGGFSPETTLECRRHRAVAVIVDLGRETDADLVVVRHCSFSCVVSGSTDGQSWTELGSLNSGTRTVELSPAQELRYVRVSLSDRGNGPQPVESERAEFDPNAKAPSPSASQAPQGGDDLTWLSEVSVWAAPPPPPRADDPTDEGDAAGAGGGGGSESGSGTALPLALGAAALLAAVGVGVAYQLGRRRTGRPGTG